jgi:hypothetical protein
VNGCHGPLEGEAASRRNTRMSGRLTLEILAKNRAHPPAMVEVVIGKLLGQRVHIDLAAVVANPEPLESGQFCGSQCLDELVAKRITS